MLIGATLEVHAASAQSANECASAAIDGQVLRDKGRLIDARERFLACSSRECPQQIRKDCTDWLEDLARRTPTASFAVTDEAGHDVSDATVSVDDVAVPGALDGRAIPLNPGPHVARFQRKQGGATEAKFVLREGERSRVISAVLKGGTKPGTVVRTPAADPAPVTSAAPFSIAWPIATGTLAAAGLAGFGIFYASALDRRDELASTCRDRCSDAQIDEVISKNRLAVVSLGIGAVAAAVTVVLLVVHGSGSGTAAARTFSTVGTF